MIDSFKKALLMHVREYYKETAFPLLNNTLTSLEEYKFINGKLKSIEYFEKLIEHIYGQMVEDKPLPGMKSKEGITYGDEFHRRD